MRLGLLLVGIASLVAVVGVQETPEPTSFACPVSQPNEFKNEFLMTTGWPDGTVVFKPGGPGSVEKDGSLPMKWPWTRFVKGQLTIDGRRLDGPHPHSALIFLPAMATPAFRRRD